MIQKQDEINNTRKTVEDKLRSMDYETYFGQMEITEEQKERRIDFARKMETKIFDVLSLVLVMFGRYEIVWLDIQQKFRDAYLDVLESYEKEVDEYLKLYIDYMSYVLMESTRDYIDDEYYTSYDRAMFIAENEANSIINYEEDEEAKLAGKTRKQWITMRDRKVRHTHREVNDKIIPIDDYFQVGNSLMRYPKDDNGSSEEIVNCRCSIKYF